MPCLPCLVSAFIIYCQRPPLFLFALSAVALAVRTLGPLCWFATKVVANQHR